MNVKHIMTMPTYIRSLFQGQPYHLVSPSPWPIITSISLLALTTSTVLTMHCFGNAGRFLTFALIILVASMFLWFKDIIIEATYIGSHTLAVQRGIAMGIGLFIISEVFFFLSVFWAFFHSSLSPTVELGAQWPPLGIECPNFLELPLLNTIILLASGVTVTYAHHSLIKGNRNASLYGIAFTIVLALVFTFCQGLEYSVSGFTISDGTFGSVFYFSTGFHGIHVLVGTIFILVAGIRCFMYHFTQNHHVGLEGSIMYWHFVDVVWLLLYMGVYWWGS